MIKVVCSGFGIALLTPYQGVMRKWNLVNTMIELQTERLILRPFYLSDAKEVQALAGHSKIADVTLNVPHPYLDGMAEDWIGSHKKNWESKQAYIFAITSSHGGKLVGCVSLIKRSEKEAEVAYWVGVPYWGLGYCTEAAKGIIKFAFEQLDLERVMGLHLTRNPASGRVMLKVGMLHDGQFDRKVEKNEKLESLEVYSINRA